MAKVVTGGLRLLTLYLIETPFNAFAKRADPDQAALIRVYSFCLWKHDISDPTLVELTSNHESLLI